ncbi:MAG: hypothetical protein OHK0029_27280 [Armatimonadaceae bacterium]
MQQLLQQPSETVTTPTAPAAMVSADTSPQTVPSWTVEQIQDALAKNDPATLAELKAWLHRVDRDNAIALLHYAEYPKSPYRYPPFLTAVWFFVCFALCGIAFHLVEEAFRGSRELPLSYFYLPGCIAGALYPFAFALRPGRKTAGMMLARLGDERALLLLHPFWQQRKKHNAIELAVAMTDAMTDALENADVKFPNLEVLRLVRAELQQRFLVGWSRDLTDSEADLYMAMIRYVAFCQYPSDRELFRRLAQLPARHANLRLVVEAARLFVETPKA